MHCFSISRYCVCLIGLLASIVQAATFDLPAEGSNIVGSVHVVNVASGNTLLDVMRHFDLGYDEITTANPGVSVWTPNAAAKVVIPTQFILPPKPWKDIVVNISARRLYYFPPPKRQQPAQVITYPISIAREGWSTPLGETRIVDKYRDPAWFVPDSIRDEHLRDDGVELPEYFPPGPDNPMGMLAMRTGFSGIYIHATNRPWGVGMRTSHGCLHLFPEDAAELFPLVKTGLHVRVIDEPVLVGFDQGRWIMASYTPVAEYGVSWSLYTRTIMALSSFLSPKFTLPHADIDWPRVQRLVEHPLALPMAVTVDQPDVAAYTASLPVEQYNFPPYGDGANNAQLPQ